MKEPSVLDYVKSRLFFWRRDRIQIPYEEGEADSGETEKAFMQARLAEQPAILAEVPEPVSPGWSLFPPGSLGMIARLGVTVTLVLMAQRALEPPGRSVVTGVVLYLVGTAWILWSNLRGEWLLPEHGAVLKSNPALTFRPLGLWICIPLGALAFLLFSNNRFTVANLTVWALAFSAFLYAFWLIDATKPPWWQRIRGTWNRFTTQGIHISPWTLLVLAVFGFSAFFRFYLLDQVPAEMFSDHAEKLIDVGNVLKGQTDIYFPRNTGREAIQMYLTALMAKVFNTGLSFISLKLGTALCGLLTLPFIYLLGVEIANRRVGLAAMFFAGIAYWPNVISRVALRFTLYPAFTAPMLYFLVRGLQRRNRNDFILSGVFLGLGLHGYSPYRFVPIAVVVVVLVYLLHRQSQGARRFAAVSLLVTGFTSFLIALPLLRYMISDPAGFSYRMMTRMGQAERAFPGPPLKIFMDNLWKALTMFFWDNGQIWVHSIPHRPAMGVVTAALTALGLIMLAIRYIRRRHWLDITLLVLIPLLVMPSVMSLAFPDENPSLNRSGGALVVVFLIAAMAFDGLMTAFRSTRVGVGGKLLGWLVGAFLLIWSASQNYDLVFTQYAQQYKNNAWNTSELGAVIRQFADSYGAEDRAWVIPYPHWVDTRLVGIRAGVPERDYALWRENISDTVGETGAKLYLVKPEDTESIDLLAYTYPDGVLRLFESQVPGREFYMFTVPPVR